MQDKDVGTIAGLPKYGSGLSTVWAPTAAAVGGPDFNTWQHIRFTMQIIKFENHGYLISTVKTMPKTFPAIVMFFVEVLLLSYFKAK